MSSEYKYDVAISLCKQDVEFARKLVKALNPSLKVFFYEDKQEELISKSGPEAFAKVFKEQSRVVVILSRNEWGKSFYTELENDAILDRLSRADREYMYSFLFVIPLVRKETPTWYPITRIYADAGHFSIEELARFIEFKVTEEGGIVKPITLEDRYQSLLARMEEKQATVQLQTSKEALETVLKETKKVKEIFNEKIQLLQKSTIGRTISFQFYDHSPSAHFAIGEHLLECTVNMPYGQYENIITTQDVVVSFQMYQISGDSVVNKNPINENETRTFYYNQEHFGWALPYLPKQTGNVERVLLFMSRKNNRHYELKNPISSAEFVDKWFQHLLKKASVNIERYLQG